MPAMQGLLEPFSLPRGKFPHVDMLHHDGLGVLQPLLESGVPTPALQDAFRSARGDPKPYIRLIGLKGCPCTP